MARRRPNYRRSPSDSGWQGFSRRHSGNPQLAHDPLYALTEPLIGAIKLHVPGFFTVDQERFERDLVQTASLGFVMHQPLGSVSSEYDHEGAQALDERQQDSTRRIDAMLADGLRRTGADPEEISTYFAKGADQRKQIAARQNAYVGWLIMNPEYQNELHQFRERWEAAIRVAGQFPRLPMWWLPDPTESVEYPPGFRDECYRFFCRWGLDTLTTWDLPVPMEPDLDIGQRRDVTLLSTGGMVLFVPWYLIRGEKLDLREVVQRSRLALAPDHLLDWVNKRGGRGGNDLGDIRYATIHWLYRFYELVLIRRYSDACAGNLQRLDQAFASVIKPKEDTVMKLRRELRRALGPNGHGTVVEDI